MQPAERAPGKDWESLRRPALYASILILIAVVHLTQDKLEALLRGWSSRPGSWLADGSLNALLRDLPSVKGFLFVLALCVLLFPVLRDAYRYLLDAGPGAVLRPLLIAAGIALFLGVLSLNPGVEGFGVTYARMSRSPFTADSSLFSTRLLMPAMAHVLFFRGFWPYSVFSVLLAVLFIALLHGWIMDFAPLPLWQFVSLCTCSFVAFQFESPGYPDVLVFIAFLLVMRPDLSYEGKLPLLVLALISHEASVLLGVVLAWRYLRRREFAVYLLTILAYAVAWAAAWNFDLVGLLASRNVGETPALQWILRYPLVELLGIAAAFKFLWIPLVMGITFALRQRLVEDARFMVAGLAGGLLMTVLGVDTWRLMGFAFPALLIALRIVQDTMPERLSKWALRGSFAANLVIPYVSVAATGEVLLPALYQRLYQRITLLWRA